MLKVLSFLKIFALVAWLFGYAEKRLDKKKTLRVNFKIYDVTDWTRNNCNTNVAQYHKK